jgi:glycosyltransferase involved in cell wall biosynthesis
VIPRVSVIVPVRDAEERIGRCLEALLAQSWPRERLEIWVVDDASRDATRERVRALPVRLLEQPEPRGPYAARNRGLRAAAGEILAFTDSDCVPAKDWVERGVAALDLAAADLAAGHVRFRLASPHSAAEILDAIANLDHEQSVALRGVANTGNLLAARRVFDAIGPFSERRSGCDVEWTARASGAGFTLVYAPLAVVEKPARGLLALARKQWRVGRGHVAMWRAAGEPASAILPRIARCFRPGRPALLRERLLRRAPAEARAGLASVWLAAWAIGTVQGLGRLHELLRGAQPRAPRSSRPAIRPKRGPGEL